MAESVRGAVLTVAVSPRVSVSVSVSVSTPFTVFALAPCGGGTSNLSSLEKIDIVVLTELSALSLRGGADLGGEKLPKSTSGGRYVPTFWCGAGAVSMALSAGRACCSAGPVVPLVPGVGDRSTWGRGISVILDISVCQTDLKPELRAEGRSGSRI